MKYLILIFIFLFSSFGYSKDNKLKQEQILLKSAIKASEMELKKLEKIKKEINFYLYKKYLKQLQSMRKLVNTKSTEDKSEYLSFILTSTSSCIQHNRGFLNGLSFAEEDLKQEYFGEKLPENLEKRSKENKKIEKKRMHFMSMKDLDNSIYYGIEHLEFHCKYSDHLISKALNYRVEETKKLIKFLKTKYNLSNFITSLQ